MTLKPAATKEIIELLNQHHHDFYSLVDISRRTQHPVPMDTRGWSQILASVVTGIPGVARKKGADLADGSDVKGANTWEAIDTPRFNGVIKAGTKATSSDSLQSLDIQPYLFMILWDHNSSNEARCRIWCIRTKVDGVFRQMCKQWYQQRAAGFIKSNNFQLHPPRGKDSNVIRNKCGNLDYPLLLNAVKPEGKSYKIIDFDISVMTSGNCTKV